MNNLQEEINELHEERNLYKEKVRIINCKISKLKRTVEAICQHDWIRERDNVMYGETFWHCRHCGKQV